ncbi:MAG: RNA 2',3'-cyclic phosphodiesterase [Gammaproteobacteria bacterium]
MSQHRDTQRLFFALWPDAGIRRRLAEMALRCSPRPVAESNLHMTLVFLGERAAQERACFSAAAAGIKSAQFTLTLDFLGGRARSGIQWLGSSQIPQALTELVGSLIDALQPCGFEAETRRFLAHVTLSRKVRKPRVEKVVEPLIWPVDSFVLVESVPESGGVRYEVLERWPLAEPG